ncbi:hypothetical protein [Clostridium ihumii]|uniref:hypothetical protein n=1 Tax=Clostridium ihumii TaxID=1470356 RepID=UPI003D354A81
MPNYKEFDLDIRNEKNNLKTMNSKKKSQGGSCGFECRKTYEDGSCVHDVCMTTGL